VVGASEEDPEDAEEEVEEEENEQSDEKKFVEKEGAFKIVGTQRNKNQAKADYVTEILTVGYSLG